MLKKVRELFSPKKEKLKPENKHFRRISKNNTGRMLAIPDIHGSAKTLHALLDKIGLTKDDTLFFLGDYIDRGINSKGVLDIIINLKSEGYQVYTLKGNHEQMLIETIKEQDAYIYEKWHKKDKLENLFVSGLEVKEKYGSFLNSLFYYFELEKFYLVHAGFNFHSKKPFNNHHDMIWIRDMEVKKEILGDRRIIHGHTPIALSKIQKSIEEGHDAINLDNGCVFYNADKIQEMGNLLCLNLDTMELFIQKNLEQEILYH